MMTISEEMRRDVLKGMFQRHSLVEHQLHSIDNFMLQMVPSIIRENETVVVKSKKFKRCHVIRFGKVVMSKPTIKTAQGTIRPIKPQECRLRGLTYSSNIYVDTIHEIYDNSVVGLRPTDDVVAVAAAAEPGDDLFIGGEVVTNTGTDLNGSGINSHGRLLTRKTYRELLLCEMPVMVNSAMCYLPEDRDPVANGEDFYDCGGYFIVNGNEKIILPQMTLRNNFPYVRHEKRNQRYALTCEIRSWNERKIRSTSTLYLRITRVKPDKLPQVLVTVPFIKYAIPLCAIFRLIGIQTVDDMFQCVACENNVPEIDFLISGVLRDRVKDGFMDCSVDDLCDKIGKKGTQEQTRDKRIRYVKHIFHNEFLPHLGLARTEEIRRAKAMYLGRVVLKTLLVFKGNLKEDDRDHIANRRCLTSGMLCGIQFRQQWRMFLKALNIIVHRYIENGKFFSVNELISSKRMTSGMKYAMATGNWGERKGASTMKGVAQMLTRTTPMAALSHSRRINTPLNRDGKAPEPRQLPASFKGLLCPCETPEGAPCGLLTNLALSTHIRIGSPTHPIVSYIYTLDLVIRLLQCTPVDIKEQCKVLVNGIWLGVTHQPEELHAALKLARHYQDIPFDASIAWIKDVHRNEMLINTDPGAFLRPVMRVDKLSKFLELYSLYSKGNLRELWNNLMTEGVLEYMDKEEEETYTVATKFDDLHPHLNTVSTSSYTHVDIDPDVMFGVCASLIPFSNHNQAPRNMYQCVDSKELVQMSDKTSKPIADVKIGDSVLCVNTADCSIVTAEVTATCIRRPTSPMVCVRTAYGSVTVTIDHKILTSTGLWVESGQLTVGTSQIAILFQLDKKVIFVPVRLLKPVNSVSRLVCDITVDSPFANFLAGDSICVHNCSMGKQAAGLSGSNFQQRVDTKSQILHYPQRPIVTTVTAAVLGHDELPDVVNVKVGIGSYTGYNQEDSIIVNKAAVDRGLLRSTVYQVFKDNEKAGGITDKDVFRIPHKKDTSGMQYGNYVLLDEEDGLVKVGTHVTHGDALIGKSMVSAPTSNRRGNNKQEEVVEQYHDRSTLWQSIEDGVVDEVMVSSGVLKENVRTTRVKVRCQRIPEIGDKLSSRHGQKGVIGILLPPEDMPYTVDGVPLDLVINPHCIPSRMTIAHLMEMLLGKVCAMEGKIGDGTPFRHTSIEQIAEFMKKYPQCGDKYGNEMVFSGFSGKVLHNKMFVGLISYQRLKHQTKEKVHGRARGPVQMLTRQPNEGRARDGGLRFGEMERDMMVSHGASAALQDRMLLQSDKFQTVCCGKCGLLAEKGRAHNYQRYNHIVDGVNEYWCRHCRTGEHVKEVIIPYAFKLLIQEMMACHVAMRLTVGEQ